MPSLFDADFEAADDLFAEAFGISVKIIRGTSEAPAVTAEVVMRDYEVMSEENFGTVLHSRDYLIAAEDYAFSGEEVAPRSGDIIHETINGVDCAFEMMPVGSRGVAEWADTNGTRWIVHTKQVKR